MLPCAPVCNSFMDKTMKIKRFHITCLWCRQRRGLNLKSFITYGYLSMSKLPATAYYEEDPSRTFTVMLPRYLMIDRKGHFTKLRCYTIVALDKLAFKLKLINNHLLANICEFLANYPVW